MKRAVARQCLLRRVGAGGSAAIAVIMRLAARDKVPSGRDAVAAPQCRSAQ